MKRNVSIVLLIVIITMHLTSLVNAEEAFANDTQENYELELIYDNDEIDYSHAIEVGIEKSENDNSDDVIELFSSDDYPTDLESMRKRADAIVNFEWYPSKQVRTWVGKDGPNKYRKSIYFQPEKPDNKPVKGVPYTLFGYGYYSLAKYKKIYSKNESHTGYVSGYGTRTGPKYGSCCADFVCEVLGGGFMDGDKPVTRSTSNLLEPKNNKNIKKVITNAKIKDIKPGDALVKKGHTIWIADVTDTVITIYEQTPPVAKKDYYYRKKNDDDKYLVWDSATYKTIIRSKEIIINNNEVIVEPEPVKPSYKESDKFPTPITCYPLKECTIYKNASGSKVKGTIKSGTQCKVKEIYTNGYAKVSCSGISGNSYIKLSALTKGSGIKDDVRVSSTQTVYRHSDLDKSIGEVYKSDSIKIVCESGNKAQIIYPLDNGGYKMGWISKSKFVGEKNSLSKISGISTPIKAYTKSTGKVTVYDKIDGKDTGHYIDGEADLCTIKAIYTNGWLKVTYPISGGSRTGYVKASKFANDFKILGKTNTSKTQAIYRRSDLKEKIGEVYKSDTMIIIGESGENIQVLYPLDNGGYKMGWIEASKAKLVIKKIEANVTQNVQKYTGQRFNQNEATVKATYYGGSTKILPFKTFLSSEEDEGVVVKNSVFEEEGTNTTVFEVSDGDNIHTAELNYEIKDPEIVSLAIKSYPKTNYIEGDVFDSTGLVIEATYEDGSKKTINDYVVSWDCDNDDVPDSDILSLGTDKIIIYAATAETSFNITVSPKTLQNISVKTTPDKTKYVEGQSLDTTGLVLTGTYNNGETIEITEGYTCSPITLNNIGKQTVTVTYEGLTTTFDVEVIQKKPIGIEIASEPTNKEVVEGTLKLDTTGMHIKVLYDSGFSENISTGFNLVGYEPRTLGEQEITVNYCGFTAKFNITVVPKTISHLEINKPAEKLEFIEGEEFSDYGLVVWGYYNNGDVEEVTEYTISGYDETVGTKNITVEYEGKSTSYIVTVVEKELIAVDIETMPTKTEYREDEALDTTGLKVVAVYNNGERLPLSTDEYTVTGFDNEPGNKGVYVNYGECSAIFEVTVKEMELTSLTIDSKPTKLQYNIGEELDLTGLSMTATYSHGKTETVDINECTISGFNKDKAGIQTVVISYRNASVTVIVNVKQIIKTTAMIKSDIVSAIKGSTVAVPVNIVNNTGISSFELDLTYDKSVLTNPTIVSGSMLNGTQCAMELTKSTDDFEMQTISWSGNKNLTQNGTVFTVYFTVSSDAEIGNYPIEISYTPEKTINQAGEQIELTCSHGQIDVLDAEVIPYKITASEATVTAGGILKYDISIANNIGLSGYKLQIMYNQSALELNKAKTGRRFTDFTTATTDVEGGIEIVGTSSGLNTQNGTLMTLEFKASEEIENGIYPISLICIEEDTYANNGTDIAVECEDGTVAITGYISGDINADGRVNNFDVMLLVGYLTGTEQLTEEQLKAADVTGDGAVDYLDYSSISSYVIGLYEGLNSSSNTAGSSVEYTTTIAGGAYIPEASISATDVKNAVPGEYVTIDVELSDNPGMSGYMITMSYDSNGLEFISAKQQEVLHGGKFEINDSIDGSTTVMWSNDDVQYENGRIFSATFKVKSADSEKWTIRFKYDDEHTGYIDEELVSNPVALLSKRVTIYTDNTASYLTLSDISYKNDVVSGQVNIAANEGLSEDADLYIAVYDVSGKLITLQKQDVKATTDVLISKEFSLTAKNVDTVKTFLWDKDAISPIVKSTYEYIR